ncbi:MAG: hypothetical protein EOO73_31840 [Myxococcales bacterium]|nr:MAG: hypothetical protein EOO73_31840 [Myxococcales bacterium]
MMRTLAFVGIAVGLTLSCPASAQDLPLISPSFTLEGATPSPCFEFACFKLSAFDGDTLAAVGAQYPAVYVFVRDAAGAWSQQAVLLHPDAGEDPRDPEFGDHLALQGDDLVVSGGQLGGLLVYHRTGTTWSYRQTLPSTGSVDLENGILVSTGADGNFAAYEKGAGGLFRQRATLKLPRSVDGYLSGPVELDRNTAIIAGGDDTDGAVFIFQRLLGVWLFVQKLPAPPAAAGGGFGTALAIDRDRIAVGAPDVPGLDVTRPGVVQTYARRGLQWRTVELLTNPVPPDGNYRAFGNALDLQGERLVISARRPSYPYASYIPGNYLYELTGNRWALSAIIDASASHAVELSGSSLLVDINLLRYGTLPTIVDLP